MNTNKQAQEKTRKEKRDSREINKQGFILKNNYVVSLLKNNYI